MNLLVIEIALNRHKCLKLMKILAMYGLVNQGLQGLIIGKYGSEVWEKIKIKSGNNFCFEYFVFTLFPFSCFHT